MAKNELQVSDFDSEGLGIELTTSSMSKEDYKEIEEYCNKHDIHISSVPTELKNKYFDNVIKLTSFFATHTNGFDIVMKKCSDMGMLAESGEVQQLAADEAQQLFFSLLEAVIDEADPNTSRNTLKALGEIASGERIATSTELYIVDDVDGNKDDEELQNQIACLEEKIECINDELEPLLSEERGYTIEDTLRVVIILDDGISRFSKRVSAFSVVNCLGYSPTLKKAAEIVPRSRQIYPDILLMLIQDARRSKEHVGEGILQKLLISCLSNGDAIAAITVEL